jgi:hypothetical protein
LTDFEFMKSPLKPERYAHMMISLAGESGK